MLCWQILHPSFHQALHVLSSQIFLFQSSFEISPSFFAIYACVSVCTPISLSEIQWIGVLSLSLHLIFSSSLLPLSAPLRTTASPTAPSPTNCLPVLQLTHSFTYSLFFNYRLLFFQPQPHVFFMLVSRHLTCYLFYFLSSSSRYISVLKPLVPYSLQLFSCLNHKFNA